MNVQEQMHQLEQESAAQKKNLTRVEHLPDKARHASEAVASVLRNVRGQLEAATARLSEIEGRQKEVSEDEFESVKVWTCSSECGLLVS